MTYMSAFIIRRHDLNVVICSLDPHDSVHIELYTLRTNVARSEIGWSEEGIHTPEPVGLRPSGAWIPSLRFFDRSSFFFKVSRFFIETVRHSFKIIVNSNF